MSNLRTADYPEHDRRRLADAVASARRAAGHRGRASFATEAKIGTRGVEAVEAAEPTVGVYVLERIGRALGRHFRGWDADTPRVILDGGAIPSLEPARRGTVDIRWVAREDLAALLDSTVDEEAHSRTMRYWERRFVDEGYTAADLQDVLQEAKEAGR